MRFADTQIKVFTERSANLVGLGAQGLHEPGEDFRDHELANLLQGSSASLQVLRCQSIVYRLDNRTLLSDLHCKRFLREGAVSTVSIFAKSNGSAGNRTFGQQIATLRATRHLASRSSDKHYNVGRTKHPYTRLNYIEIP